MEQPHLLWARLALAKAGSVVILAQEACSHDRRAKEGLSWLSDARAFLVQVGNS